MEIIVHASKQKQRITLKVLPLEDMLMYLMDFRQFFHEACHHLNMQAFPQSARPVISNHPMRHLVRTQIPPSTPGHSLVLYKVKIIAQPMLLSG